MTLLGTRGSYISPHRVAPVSHAESSKSETAVNWTCLSDTSRRHAARVCWRHDENNLLRVQRSPVIMCVYVCVCVCVCVCARGKGSSLRESQFQWSATNQTILVSQRSQIPSKRGKLNQTAFQNLLQTVKLHVFKIYPNFLYYHFYVLNLLLFFVYLRKRFYRHNKEVKLWQTRAILYIYPCRSYTHGDGNVILYTIATFITIENYWPMLEVYYVAAV